LPALGGTSELRKWSLRRRPECEELGSAGFHISLDGIMRSGVAQEDGGLDFAGDIERGLGWSPMSGFGAGDLDFSLHDLDLGIGK
jgi:hypothetical protein